MTLEAEFAEHAPFLRALARVLAADPSAADDLVQDTYVAALGERSGQVARLVPWLATVLRNRAARRLRGDSRRRAREHAAARDANSPDTLTVASKLEVSRRLLQHVEALDARSREVVYLRFYQDRKPTQIAAELDLPLGTIKTRLARALARLRERLDADDPQGQRDWLPALCAIGGIEPGAAVSGNAALLHRRFLPRHARLAAVGAVVTTVAVGALLLDLMAPDTPPSRTAEATATATESAADARGMRRAVDLSAPFTVVHGLVEDANFGAVPGTGTPASGVVVRCELRQPSAVADTTSERAAAADPRRLAAPPAAGQHTVELEATTNARGRFRIDLPQHAVLISVEARGNEVVRRAKWSATQNSGPLPAPLVLTRYLHGALPGIVVDPSGAGVARATVRLARWQDQERVAVETTADESGRFVFANVATDSWLEAECPGFVQVGATAPRMGRRGGWEPGRIVLARGGTLAVEVVNAAGDPARHADGIGVMISAAEYGLAAQTRCNHPFRHFMPIAQARARLIVPAGLQLQLWAGDSVFVGERNGDAVALSGPQTGQPIVVAAGEERALRVVLGTDAEVHGTVVDPDGEPVAEAAIWWHKVRNARLESAGMAKTDARGHFDLHLTGAVDRQPLLVVARGSGASAELRASRCLQVGGTEPTIIELRLAKPLDLVGHVCDAEGRPVDARVRCRVELPGMAQPVDGAGECTTDERGAFRIQGYLDVPHRLEVLSDHHGAVTVDGVRPGDAPIELLVGQTKLTRIRLRANSPLPLANLEVRVCYLKAGADPQWPLLGASTTWSHLAPPCALPRTVRADETWRFEQHWRYTPVDGIVEVSLNSGPAWILVSGCACDGEQLSRLATGAVTIPPGEIALSVELSPTVTCRGRVEFGENTERFAACVAIADDAGRLLGVSVLGLEHDWDRIVPTGSNGWFALGSIPRGTWELRAGTRAELERGEARVRQRLVFADDLAEAITLRM